MTTMTKCFLVALAVPVFSIGIFAQPPANEPSPPKGEMPAPKNLKLLDPATLMPKMQEFRTSLNVQCDFCHVRGDFASDEKHHKAVAREMIVMAREINAKFPDGKTHVTCYTCHRGQPEPPIAPPAAAEAKPSN